jgi:hypothetical protein
MTWQNFTVLKVITSLCLDILERWHCSGTVHPTVRFRMESPDPPSSSRVRRYWTEEEDRILRREAAKQCMTCQLCLGGRRPHTWMQLRRPSFTFFLASANVFIVSKKGAVKQWNLVAQKLDGRTNKDCRKRWNKIGREVNKGPWSKEEDDRLRNGVQQYDTRYVERRSCCRLRGLSFDIPNIAIDGHW